LRSGECDVLKKCSAKYLKAPKVQNNTPFKITFKRHENAQPILIGSVGIKFCAVM